MIFLCINNLYLLKKTLYFGYLKAFVLILCLQLCALNFLLYLILHDYNFIFNYANLDDNYIYYL